jgi:hypothetical protein
MIGGGIMPHGKIKREGTTKGEKEVRVSDPKNQGTRGPWLKARPSPEDC